MDVDLLLLFKKKAVEERGLHALWNNKAKYFFSLWNDNWMTPFNSYFYYGNKFNKCEKKRKTNIPHLHRMRSDIFYFIHRVQLIPKSNWLHFVKWLNGMTMTHHLMLSPVFQPKSLILNQNWLTLINKYISICRWI